MVKTRQSSKFEECEIENLNEGRANFANQQISNEIDRETLCARVIRKKYRCMMLFFLIVYLSLQVTQLVLTKVYPDIVQYILIPRYNMMNRLDLTQNFTTALVSPEYIDQN